MKSILKRRLGLFRPGIAVALAAEITRDGAIAQLLSNPAATDIVVVEPIWQPQAVAAIRAPAATPSAAPSESPPTAPSEPSAD